MTKKNKKALPGEWISIDKFLPKNFGFDYNDEIEGLIEYIEKKRETFQHETDDINKPLIIRIPPVGEAGRVTHNFESQKFLVYLSRNGVISNLYLPVSVKRLNQNILNIEFHSVFFDAEDALSDCLDNPDKFQKQVIKFELVNWDKFLEIKKWLSEKIKKPTMPSDPEIIKEYLWIVNQIEKERQRTPNGEPIAYPVSDKTPTASGAPMPEKETLILKKFEQEELIKITTKKVERHFPYAPGVTDFVRAVIIPDSKKFEDYQTKLLEAEERQEIESSEVKYVGLTESEIKGLEGKNAPQKQQKNNTIAIPIKKVRLDEQNYLLEINGGERIISFKSKKKIKKLESEEDLTPREKAQLEQETLKTKQWKILRHLWDFRWELKGSNVLEKGDFTSLNNLMKGSGSESTEATYKHIRRLNKRFENEGVAIEIKGENEKYRLIINKA